MIWSHSFLHPTHPFVFFSLWRVCGANVNKVAVTIQQVKLYQIKIVINFMCNFLIQLPFFPTYLIFTGCVVELHFCETSYKTDSNFGLFKGCIKVSVVQINGGSSDECCWTEMEQAVVFMVNLQSISKESDGFKRLCFFKVMDTKILKYIAKYKALHTKWTMFTCAQCAVWKHSMCQCETFWYQCMFKVYDAG